MMIHISRQGQRLGPFSLEDTQSRLTAGTLYVNDLAWYEGLPGWIPLPQVPGLKAAAPRRPALVWVICLYYFIRNPYHLLLPVLLPIMRGQPPSWSAVMQFYPNSRIVTLILISDCSWLVMLAGAVCLFLLRRHALVLFILAFVIGLVATISGLVMSYAFLPARFYWETAGSYTLGIAVIAYTWHLFRKGVLR